MKTKFKIDVVQIMIFIISLFSAFSVSKIYYQNNITSNIDKYNMFIYGDTTLSKYSKDVDFNVIIILITIFFVMYIGLALLNKYKFQKEKFVEVEMPSVSANFSLEKFFDNILILFFSYYSAYTICSLLTIHSSINSKMIWIVTIIVVAFSKIVKGNKAVVVSQLALPLIYTELLVKNTITIGTETNYIYLPMSIKVMAILLIILSYIFIYQSYKKNEKISFSTVMFFIFIMIVTLNISSFWFNMDEYHNGESITAYQQIYEFGQGMYTEYIPVKGFMHIFGGWLNAILFNDNYLMMNIASPLAKFGVMVVVYYIMSRYIGNMYTLLIVLFGLIGYEGYLLIIPSLFILTDKRLHKSKYDFLLAYCFLSFFYIVYYQSFGMAFAGSLFLVAVISAVELYKTKEKPTKKQWLIFAGGVLLFILCLRPIIGMLEYSLMNASTNKYYWGNSSGYKVEDTNGFWKRFFVYNLWIYIWMSIVIYTVTRYKKLSFQSKIALSSMILYPLFIFTYMYARHDNGFVRVNAFSSTYLYWLVIYIFVLSSKNKKLRMVSICTLVIGFVYSEGSNMPIKAITDRFNYVNRIEFKNTFAYGEEFEYLNDSDIPNIHNGVIQKDRKQELETEYLLIDTILEEDETFLIIDEYVTQSARYYLYDKKIPTMSHALLNVTSLKEQIRELEKVKNSNVEIVRYVPTGLSRYYMFYDYYLNKALSGEFVNTYYQGYSYLISKEKFDKYKDVLGLKESPMDIAGMSRVDFGTLPLKWGKGYKHTKEDLVQHNNELTLKVANQATFENNILTINDNADPYIEFELSSNIVGNQIDYIKINLDTDIEAFRGQLYWKDEINGYSEKNSVQFDCSSGDLIIPVGMNTNWKMSNEISGLRLDFSGLGMGSKIKINNAEFLQLEELNNVKGDNVIIGSENVLILNDQQLMLADITDENWTGGIANDSPRLLVRNEGNIADIINISKFIILPDGQQIKITNVEVLDGNYIYVYVENIVQEQMQYPNVLKLAE